MRRSIIVVAFIAVGLFLASFSIEYCGVSEGTNQERVRFRKAHSLDNFKSDWLARATPTL